MRIDGPETFRLTIHTPPAQTRFEILDVKGATRFSGRATSRLPKLYVVAAGDKPIYVGVTKQPMRARLRFGWDAKGQSGYYGYRWRHHHTEVQLDVWYELDPPERGSPLIGMETVEAEVVFLIRQRGQWPAFQTEIHFHESTPEHREAAARIMSHYE
jgi:hypothetical protein